MKSLRKNQNTMTSSRRPLKARLITHVDAVISLFKSAWALQERLLSCRIVHFTKGEWCLNVHMVEYVNAVALNVIILAGVRGGGFPSLR